MHSKAIIRPMKRPSLQRGLSLVELMIASVLGLILLAALTQLFSNMTFNNRELAKTNSQIENARFAIQFLSNDIAHAGYWGPHVPEFDDLMSLEVPSDTPTLVPDPCLAFASWSANYIDALLGIPVQSYNGSPSAACTSQIADLADRLAGTDVLVVRHAERCVTGLGNCDADAAGELYFQPSNCATEIDAGTFYSLDPNSYTLTARDCTALADKYKFVQNIYFIRDYAVSSGDGIPTLVRSRFGLSGGTLQQLPAEPLVQGIQGFRVEIGVDSLSETGDPVNYAVAVDWTDPKVWTEATNRGDGAPDGAFLHCGTAACDPNDFMNTTAVKLYVLARADAATLGYIDAKTYNLGGGTLGPFNDDFKRHVFSSTVRVNNVAGRRETP